MKFDDILVKYLGEFGPYQKLQFFLVCLPTIYCAMHSLSWTFTGAQVPVRCKLSDEKTLNMSDETNVTFYVSSEYKRWLLQDGMEIMHTCNRVKGFTVRGDLNASIANGMEPCVDEYVWNHEEITNNALERWSIVCNRSWIRAFIQSMYYVGQFLGSLFFGIAADRYGRKKAFFLAIVIQIISGTLSAYAPWWPLFAILRIGLGFSHPGIFLIAVVIGMELVGPSRRVMAGVMTGIFFSVGQIILGYLAYHIRDYQHLQLAISASAVVFLIYWWIVPESARWLITQKRYEEADAILQRAAKFNNVYLPSNWYQMLDTEIKSPTDSNRRYGYADLFRTPKIRKRFLITCLICWPAISAVYYGLTMNPSMLGGDRYTVFIALGFFEIPALLVLMVVMNLLGRKLITMGGFLAAAFSLLATRLVPADSQLVSILMLAMAKSSLCVVYAVLYVFTPELFPTVIRSTAMGCCSMVARIGAFSAAYIAMWLVFYSKIAVVLILGAMCLIAGASVIVLPETTGQKQFDTIEDAEKFGQSQPLFSMAFKKRQSIEMDDVVDIPMVSNEAKKNLLNSNVKS